MDFSSNLNESYCADKQIKRQLFACVKKHENRAELAELCTSPIFSLPYQDNLISKKRSRLGWMKKSSNFHEGRWEAEEHERFLKACYDHGEDWDKIEEAIHTRNIVQIRSHAQKYIIKLCKKYSIKLNKKKFKNKKSVHLEWSEKDENQKKLDINKMNKYDRNILKMFSYYDRDYTKAKMGSTEQIVAVDPEYACEENQHIQALEKYEKIQNYVNIINSYSNYNFEDLKAHDKLENLKNSENLDNPSGPTSTTVEENLFSKNKNNFMQNYSHSKFVKFNISRNKCLKEDLTCHPFISKLNNTNTFLHKNKIFKTFSELDSMDNNYTFTNETLSSQGCDKSKIYDPILTGSITCSDENLDHSPMKLIKNFNGLPLPQKLFDGLTDILNSSRSFQEKLFPSKYDSNLSNLYDLFPLLFNNISSCINKQLMNSFKNECLNGIYYLSKMDKNLKQFYVNHNDNIKILYEESRNKQRNYVLSVINKNKEFNKM